jgi:glycosyltransferase involved in cell wall biosynthesis
MIAIMHETRSFSQVWVAIAAYNEASVIARVISSLSGCGYNIVVVDDGSRDATHDIALANGAVTIRHPVNLGQGAALQTGIAYALSRGADAIVTFDADGQHLASDIAALLAALKRDRSEFALGSRFLGRSLWLPVSRRLLLRAATLFTRLTTGLNLTDTHNGLRALTRRGAKAIHLRQNRMAHASEILSQIAGSGLRYSEVPVTVEYTAYSLAKGQRLGDSLTILFDLFAEKLHR